MIKALLQAVKSLVLGGAPAPFQPDQEPGLHLRQPEGRQVRRTPLARQYGKHPPPQSKPSGYPKPWPVDRRRPQPRTAPRPAQPPTATPDDVASPDGDSERASADPTGPAKPPSTMESVSLPQRGWIEKPGEDPVAAPEPVEYRHGIPVFSRQPPGLQEAPEMGAETPSPATPDEPRPITPDRALEQETQTEGPSREVRELEENSPSPIAPTASGPTDLEAMPARSTEVFDFERQATFSPLPGSQAITESYERAYSPPSSAPPPKPAAKSIQLRPMPPASLPTPRDDIPLTEGEPPPASLGNSAQDPDPPSPEEIITSDPRLAQPDNSPPRPVPDVADPEAIVGSLGLPGGSEPDLPGVASQSSPVTDEPGAPARDYDLEGLVSGEYTRPADAGGSSSDQQDSKIGDIQRAIRELQKVQNEIREDVKQILAEVQKRQQPQPSVWGL